MSIVGKVWRASRQRPHLLFDLFRAVAELALARWKFGRLDVDELIKTAQLIEARFPVRELSQGDREMIERVRFAIAAVGSRLPFRSDCLIQAIAAQHWLGSLRVTSSLKIGVRSGGDVPFEAHAWLVRDGVVITGGDVAGYNELIGNGYAQGARGT